jgi:hypothetical protein
MHGDLRIAGLTGGGHPGMLGVAPSRTFGVAIQAQWPMGRSRPTSWAPTSGVNFVVTKAFVLT